MGQVWNSSIERRTPLKATKPMARSSVPMKRGGRLRPIRKTLPGTDARIKQLLTKAVSVYVRMRDPVCVVCSKRRSTQAGHYFHRDTPPVEFDLRNVYGICGPCNYRHETENHHMRDQVFKRLGEREFDELCTLAHNHKFKLSTIELGNLLAELTERIAEQRI